MDERKVKAAAVAIAEQLDCDRDGAMALARAALEAAEAWEREQGAAFGKVVSDEISCIVNCVISSRPGDQALFKQSAKHPGTYVVHLDGYRIAPVEEWMRERVAQPSRDAVVVSNHPVDHSRVHLTGTVRKAVESLPDRGEVESLLASLAKTWDFDGEQMSGELGRADAARIIDGILALAVERVRREMFTDEGARDWQPIETAPRDGACIEARDARGVIERIFFGDGIKRPAEWHSVEGSNAWSDLWEPVAWRPLSGKEDEDARDG